MSYFYYHIWQDKQHVWYYSVEYLYLYLEPFHTNYHIRFLQHNLWYQHLLNGWIYL